MARIQLLPPDVAQKIAAGEVIERPFSVVKELVENSLDAGASDIRVELEAGGKRLIKVVDNGGGMSPEDAAQCFGRHATSKIASEADLERISTFGFRGEALASIAAVSELVLRTADGASASGIRIERRGGEIVSVREIAFPRGTSLEAANLFFNLPARRKFLRSDQSELALVTRYLTGVALAHPEVRFGLTHGPREILSCPPVGSIRERLFQLYGRDTIERLIEIDFARGENRVFGFGSRPPEGRPQKAQQLFFVNRRPVKDRTLQAALNQSYRRFLEKNLFPEAYVFLSVPFGEVDVNVHPAKAEVRFRDSQAIFFLLLQAVEKAAIDDRGVKEVYPEATGKAAGPAVRESAWPAMMPPPPGAAESQSELFQEGPRALRDPGLPRLLGQYLDTYIVAAGADGLLVIDQHNAHERVLFDEFREIDASRRWPQKAALVPVLLDLSPSQVVSLEISRPALESAGFRVEPMGERTYALAAFPDIFGAEEARDSLLEILEGWKPEGEPDRRLDKMLATLACHTAVKAHQALPREQMEYLIEKLFKTAHPSVCPHGRPIVVKLEKSAIEKGLKRIS